MGLRTTKGVLLYGPPGTGKTSLARLCIRDAGVNLFSVNGAEIVHQYYGESEQALHEIFDSASQAAPAVVRFLQIKKITFSDLFHILFVVTCYAFFFPFLYFKEQLMLLVVNSVFFFKFFQKE